jgi:hypothetical protein
MLAGAIVRTVAPADVALRSPHRAELRIERNTDLLLCHVITSLSMPPRFKRMLRRVPAHRGNREGGQMHLDERSRNHALHISNSWGKICVP